MKWLKQVFKKQLKGGSKQIARAYRVRLLPSEFIFFQSEEEKFAILNLSESGLAIQNHGKDWAVGTKISGKIMAGHTSPEALGAATGELFVELEIMRKSERDVGCRFANNTPEIKLFLWKLFKEEIQASEMYEISRESLAHDQEGKPRWFYAPGSYSLFLLENNERVTNAELTLGLDVFLGNDGKPLRWGTITEEDREKPSHTRASIVEWKDSVKSSKRLKALRVLENLKDLSPEQKAQIKKLFENH